MTSGNGKLILLPLMVKEGLRKPLPAAERDRRRRLSSGMAVAGDPVTVLPVLGSPGGGGRTATVVASLGAAAQAAGARVLPPVDLATSDPTEAVPRLGEGEAFILGAPVYRASMAYPLKDLLDATPRGMWGESEAPLTGRAVTIALTGASWHHFLALDHLRGVLAGFFAAHVLSPGLYVPPEGHEEDGGLEPSFAEQAERQGRGLVELARAVRGAEALTAATPQA
ncbi:MAG: NAD(P)H-dependent oxidoreductase [Solirubrobacterales bacterium]